MTKKKILTSIDGIIDNPPKSLQRGKKTKSPVSIFDNASSCPGFLSVDDQAFRLFPEQGQWMERFIQCLIEWARLDSALEIMQFCQLKALPYRTFKDWVHRYPEFGKAVEEAKLLLASRRRLGALTRKYDREVVFKDMYRYDPEWKEVDRYHAELRNNNQEQDRNITIVIPPMPSVDSVKKRDE